MWCFGCALLLIRGREDKKLLFEHSKVTLKHIFAAKSGVSLIRLLFLRLEKRTGQTGQEEQLK